MCQSNRELHSITFHLKRRELYLLECSSIDTIRESTIISELSFAMFRCLSEFALLAVGAALVGFGKKTRHLSPRRFALERLAYNRPLLSRYSAPAKTESSRERFRKGHSSSAARR